MIYKYYKLKMLQETIKTAQYENNLVLYENNLNIPLFVLSMLYNQLTKFKM